MKYYIGIDGGGTKTEFQLTNESGQVLAGFRRGSASYKQIQEEGVTELLEKGIADLWKQSGVTEQGACFSCFGMPMYGEHRQHDERIMEQIARRLGRYHIKVVNDVEVGWAGSLELEAGINIVAGTGSIGFGRNQMGEAAKAGGWSEFFSDEGSCYWLGKKAVEYFAKEADGRLEKSELYKLFKFTFELENDYDIIGIIEENYMPYRDKTASLQMILKDAALAGDQWAVQLYEQAAYELSLIVKSIHTRLHMGRGCKVSYSGGLFQVGALVLEPLARYLESLEVNLQSPRRSPAEGAVLLARYYEGRQ